MGLWRPAGREHAHGSSRSSTPRRSRCSSLGIVAAALRGRPPAQRAARAGAMLGAAVTSQMLKPLLATPARVPAGHFMGPEAWPSGHTTAVMSFALALVIVARRAGARSPPRPAAC